MGNHSALLKASTLIKSSINVPHLCSFSSRSQLINITTHRLELRLPRRHQIADLRDVADMFVARELVLCVRDWLVPLSFRDSEEVP